MSPAPAAWRRFAANRAALAGALVVLAAIVGALLAPVLAPWDPLAMPDPVGLQGAPPSLAHFFGTDAFSRDVFARLLFGARVSLTVGIVAALAGVVIGGGVGLAAGLGGPVLDAGLMRGVDVLLALPRLLLLMAAFALFDRVPLWATVLLIAATGWLETSRLVRAHVRQLRTADFVTASVALGGGRRRIARHLLPHVAATLIVSASLDVGGIILLESALAFLGLGTRPPAPSWGNMILEGRALLFSAPWVALAPGLALTVTAVAFNLLGDGLRDALDPRQAR
jgi:peptide/nickel transport system permease protein